MFGYFEKVCKDSFKRVLGFGAFICAVVITFTLKDYAMVSLWLGLVTIAVAGTVMEKNNANKHNNLDA